LYHAAGSAAVSPSLAAAIVTATLATYLVVAMVVPRSIVVLAAQAVLAVVPVAAMVVARGRALRSALGLRLAPPRFFVAAIAIGATTWYLNMWIVALLPITERQTRALTELVDRPSLVAALAMFALVPAVCEEIVFRGILARALGGSLRLIAAAVISAAVFSLYHLSLAQAVPTLTLGALLAVIAIRADSVLPTMVAHALNNVMAIVMSRDELPDLAGWLARHPAAGLAGCASATALGLTIALRAPGHAPDRPRSDG
jgi:sodium transport system permease protein